MERASAVKHRTLQLSGEDFSSRVVWHLQVLPKISIRREVILRLRDPHLGTGHDAWQVIVGPERGFVRLANDSERRIETAEAIDRQSRRTSGAKQMRPAPRDNERLTTVKIAAAGPSNRTT